MPRLWARKGVGSSSSGCPSAAPAASRCSLEEQRVWPTKHANPPETVSYTHLRAHETGAYL
eukprot:3897565-Pyramimonas_sp.AAC.1